MEFLTDFILHIDQYLIRIVQDYHLWTYAILFLIIFCETGLSPLTFSSSFLASASSSIRFSSSAASSKPRCV